MSDPIYPKTPMKNCLYCKEYNAKSNTCTSPHAYKIANFAPDLTKDCKIMVYDKSETAQVPEKNFADTYCIGKKCPFYWDTKNLCTRPSKCPYQAGPKGVFKNVKFKTK